MKQEKPIKNVQLKFVCEQDWHKMTPCGDGRFCAVCRKVVYDFTNKSQADLDKAVRQHNGNICGRFQQNQAKMPSKMQNSVKKAAVLAASLAAVGCENLPIKYHNQQPENTHLMGGEFEQRFMGKFAVPRRLKDSTPYFLGIITEQQAEFIGGQAALSTFIEENIQRSKLTPREKTETGTVYVGFTVEIDGTVSNISIKRGNNASFNAEVLRVIQLTSGKWKAGKSNGKLVKTNFTMPIKFPI